MDKLRKSRIDSEQDLFVEGCDLLFPNADNEELEEELLDYLDICS